MERPEFDDIRDYDEFCKYYWYRDELIKICRAHGLKAPSGKIELNKVIEAYFSGEKILPEKKRERKNRSVVKELTLDTGLIACGFTFGNRFREFFSEQTGVNPFKFNVDMVATAKAVKENGDESFTLGDLLDIYYGKKTYAVYDKSMLQWNRFVKDFCEDDSTMVFRDRLKAAATLWKVVRESDMPKEYSHELFEKYRDRILYNEYARRCSSNRVYPMSIVEGLQDGRIIPDDENNVKAVLFWHFCGFAYLSGDVDETFLQRIYEDFFLVENERRFILITDNPKVIHFFSNKEDMESDKRVEYHFDTLTQEDCKCDYKVERINELNFDKIQGRIIPSFSWSSKEQFLENGFGYVAMDGDRVVAIAFSAAVSSDEVDVGVETDENYRHKGLAKALADIMCREIVSTGRKPVWAHAISNEGSKHTALSVGFAEDRVNTVIMKEQ